jgi:hypothetical protein
MREEQERKKTLLKEDTRVGYNFQLCVNLWFEMIICPKQRDEEFGEL